MLSLFLSVWLMFGAAGTGMSQGPAGAIGAEYRPQSSAAPPDDGADISVAMAPGIACMDRLLADPIAQAAIDTAETDWMPRSGAASPAAAPSAAAKEAIDAVDQRMNACADLVATNKRAHDFVEMYLKQSLMARLMARDLRSASVDLDMLDRIASQPDPNASSAMVDPSHLDLMAEQVRAAGVPDGVAKLAGAYVMMVRMKRLLDGIGHPPATPARRIGDPVVGDDYPRRALIKGAQGKTSVVIYVSDTGAVDGCALLVSSGHAALDRRACEVITARYRFEPARDASGKPVAQAVFNNYLWIVR